MVLPLQDSPPGTQVEGAGKAGFSVVDVFLQLHLF